MRSPRRRPARLALAATCATLLFPLTVAAPANAASWTTLSDVDGAAPQACKVPADGRAVKVRVRVVNGSSQTADATFVVMRGATTTGRTAFSTVPGQTTSVRVLRVPDPRTHTFGFGLSTPDGGLGDTDALGYVRRC